jgi:hypothetical protein
MTTSTPEWLFAHASVRGKSHIDAGIPNQDALHLATSPDKRSFSLVISDGAGSARYAEEGARHFSRFIGNKLLELTMELSEQPTIRLDKNAVGDSIIQIVAAARQALDLRGAQLRDYACNLVALSVGPNVALRVHLGDAVLMKSSFVHRPDQTVDYFVDTRMTAQERSEYANETHFLTQSDWTRHLFWDFLDPNGPEDMYVLMSDGAADIALSNVPGSDERRVFRGFFSPLIARVLEASPSDQGRVIEDALANPKTFIITGDDKTMAVIIRARGKNWSGFSPYMKDSSPALPAAPPPAVQPPPTVTAPVTIPVATPTTAPVTAPIAAPANSSIKAPKTQIPNAAPSRSLPPVRRPDRLSWHFTSIALGALFGLTLGVSALPAYHWVQAKRQAPASPSPITNPADPRPQAKSPEKASSAPAATSSHGTINPERPIEPPVQGQRAGETEKDASKAPVPEPAQGTAPPPASTRHATSHGNSAGAASATGQNRK